MNGNQTAVLAFAYLIEARKAKGIAKNKGVSFVEQTSTLENHSFDVISMWHVLEHVPNLDNQIKELKRLLKPNGTLIIAVPNFKSFDAKHYKSNWAAYDVPRHIYHFNPETIQSIAKKHGFKLAKQHGQIFDSFYIALLSHEYKTGSKKLIASFFVGLWSNLIAYFKTGNYSSNIYIFEHA